MIEIKQHIAKGLSVSLFLFFVFNQLFAHTEDTLRIGILAKRSTDICLAEWQATADYLNEHIAEKEFVIVPMQFEQFRDMDFIREIHFFISNPALFILLEQSMDVKVMTTMKRLYGGKEYDYFGGVVFTYGLQNEVKELADIKGKRIAAVDKTSFGGWQVAKRQMLYERELKGIKDDRIVFTGSHDRVVRLVLDGVADVGIVRTGILESMANSGELDLEKVNVVGKCGNSFPLFCSTQLYSEWPLSYSGIIEEELIREVAILMLSLSKTDSACIDAGISGWELPGNYQDVKACLQKIKAPPFEDYGELKFSEVFKQYAPWMLLVIGVFAMIVLGLYIRIFRLKILSGQLTDEEKGTVGRHKRKGVFILVLFILASALLGSILLVSLSMLQKTIMGVEIALNGFIIPSTFGAATGITIGLAFNRVITQREQMKFLNNRLDVRNTELKEARDRAISADRLKTSFLNNLSHEIRTPLNGIMGFVDLVHNSDLKEEELKNYTDLISRSSERLLQTIDDLVNMSLINAGLMEVEIGEVNGGEVVLQEVSMRRRDLEGKDLKLEICEGFQSRELTLRADRNKLISVIHHLLDNAIKFSYSGGMIKIACEESEGYVMFSIEDNGKGIDKEKQEGVYHQFSKGKEATIYSDSDGVGLGLSISKAYVEFMGGEIWFESEAGKGSRFYFTIPVA